jgi:hypothetical protein
LASGRVPRVATSHGHHFTKIFLEKTDKNYFLAIWARVGFPKCPLALATIFPGSSHTRNNFWPFGLRKGPGWPLDMANKVVPWHKLSFWPQEGYIMIKSFLGLNIARVIKSVILPYSPKIVKFKTQSNAILTWLLFHQNFTILVHFAKIEKLNF